MAEKAVQSDVSGLTGGLPTVAITSASMEFISDGKQNDERLTITGNDYRHMLQPQTSATPSNISEQTMATDTTVGSDVNLLSNKPSLSIDQVRFLTILYDFGKKHYFSICYRRNYIYLILLNNFRMA